jgi:hypothetical protein
MELRNAHYSHHILTTRQLNRSYTALNPLLLLFKALLHGQKDCIFFQWAFKCIGQQERFRAFRPARDI